MKINKKAFTLVELLVVVLIIGILAAIAVPQYQFAVGKTQFNSIKNITRSLRDACEVYYTATGQYPSEYSQLDISLPDIQKTVTTNNELIITFKNGNQCWIWFNPNVQDQIACFTKINNIQAGLYLPLYRRSFEKALCLIFSLDQNSIPHKICQQETGKAEPNVCFDNSKYCQYQYKNKF